jgi:hypothetical protein
MVLLKSAEVRVRVVSSSWIFANVVDNYHAYFVS